VSAGTAAGGTGRDVPFDLPPYPYDLLEALGKIASRHEGGLVDCSVGTPCDPPPAVVGAALSGAGALSSARGYPPSMGTAALRAAFRSWISRRFDVELPDESLAVCAGTKELVAALPGWLHRLRGEPWRDTVLFPATSYPTYAFGALMAGLRAVPVMCDERGVPLLESVSESDAVRAVLCWVNSPSNPTGALTDLAAAARWGRSRGVLVASDECYAEFTWSGPPRTILSEGVDGLLALHSLSKRSNLAGLRVGCYAGDPELVRSLSEIRKHAGLMVPGPAQEAAIAALGDDEHVHAQRARYRERIDLMLAVLDRAGIVAPAPGGGFYLWAERAGSPAADGGPPGDASRARGRTGVLAEAGAGWDLARFLAEQGGCLVAPGDLYRTVPGDPHVRIALVQPIERLKLVERRLLAAGPLTRAADSP